MRGYPQVGKRPIYFRFFLLKASLSQSINQSHLVREGFKKKKGKTWAFGWTSSDPPCPPTWALLHYILAWAHGVFACWMNISPRVNIFVHFPNLRPSNNETVLLIPVAHLKYHGKYKQDLLNSLKGLEELKGRWEGGGGYITFLSFNALFHVLGQLDHF